MMRRSSVTRTGLALAAGLLALTFPLSSGLLGYVTTGHAWRTTQISYYVNPQSLWVSPSMPSWCDTTLASLDADDIAGVESLYPPARVPATPTQLTATQNLSNPASSLKLTWLDNASNETGYQVDRSVDGANFLARTSLGSNSQSYTDTGLAAGTLYYYRVRAVNGSGASAFSNSASSQTASASGPNTAPVVSIATPYAGSVYPAGTTVSFSGSATDTTDGNISNKLVWTSSIDGQIGTGSAFSKVLSPGAHTVTAKATDAGGLTGSTQVSLDVGASQSATPSLAVRGYKVKGLQRADLTWSGLSSASIDVYRKGVKVMTTPNDGSQTDAINAKGSGTYSYKVCAAGTGICSPAVTVTF